MGLDGSFTSHAASEILFRTRERVVRDVMFYFVDGFMFSCVRDLSGLGEL